MIIIIWKQIRKQKRIIIKNHKYKAFKILKKKTISNFYDYKVKWGKNKKNN